MTSVCKVDDLAMMEGLHDLLQRADKAEMASILRHFCEEAGEEELRRLKEEALAFRRQHYGDKVYFRGLIEASSYCTNDCSYCGIRAGNHNAVRYRLTEEDILASCESGYNLGFRTYVLQGGEDGYFSDERLVRIVKEIKRRWPDTAVTISFGERSEESYRLLKEAGADRYLLRHETADTEHYAKLHPASMSGQNRLDCLWTLKRLGFEVGAGFMVDSPFQTYETLAEDFLFLRALQPEMVGIGPFIPHKDSVYSAYPKAASGKTIILISLLRILLPKVLLPVTTALGTVDSLGREKGLQAGANVVMPNLSPITHRKDYDIYDNKICTGEEAAECFGCLSRRIQSAGFVADFSRGSHVDRDC